MRRRLPRSGAVVSGIVLVALYAPIVLVLIGSFNADPRLVSWEGATTRWYEQAARDPAVRDALTTTLAVAAAATICSLLIALTAVLWWRGASPRGRRFLDAITAVRIVLPEVVLAIGLFLVLRRVGVALGTTTIVVGHVVFCSAYATIVLQARMSTLPRTYDEAAADLGATPWRVLRRVTLPLLAPALVVAALLTVTLSLDDVVVAQFLGGTESQTLPVLLLGKIRLRVTPEVNAIGVAIMALTLLTFIAAALVVSRRPGATGALLGTRRGGRR